jgi:hypothetical protein
VNIEERHALLAGRVSWQDIAQGKPGWLRDELILTAAGHARLMAWAAVCDDVQRPNLPAAVIRQRIVYVGDSEILDVITLALARIAPPVCDTVLAQALFVGVGRSANAWVSVSPAASESKPAIIAISGVQRNDNELATTVAHECAHAWLHTPWNGERNHTTAERRAFVEDRAFDGIPTRFVAHVVQCCERQAAALARAWGFTGRAADVSRCGKVAQAG